MSSRSNKKLVVTLGLEVDKIVNSRIEAAFKPIQEIFTNMSKTLDGSFSAVNQTLDKTIQLVGKLEKRMKSAQDAAIKPMVMSLDLDTMTKMAGKSAVRMGQQFSDMFLKTVMTKLDTSKLNPASSVGMYAIPLRQMKEFDAGRMAEEQLAISMKKGGLLAALAGRGDATVGSVFADSKPAREYLDVTREINSKTKELASNHHMAADGVAALGYRFMAAGYAMQRTGQAIDQIMQKGRSAAMEQDKLRGKSESITPGNKDWITLVSAGQKPVIEQLAIEFGQSTDMMLEALYTLKSAFPDLIDPMSRLREVGKLAAAGFTDASAAVNAFVSIGAAYNDTSDEMVSKISSLVTQTARSGVVEVDELIAQLQKIAPSAAAAGVELEEMFAMFGTQANVSGSLSMVATQFRSLLIQIGELNTKGLKGLKEGTEEYTQSAIANGKELIDHYGGLRETLEAIQSMVGNGSWEGILSRDPGKIFAKSFLGEENIARFEAMVAELEKVMNGKDITADALEKTLYGSAKNAYEITKLTEKINNNLADMARVAQPIELMWLRIQESLTSTASPLGEILSVIGRLATVMGSFVLGSGGILVAVSAVKKLSAEFGGLKVMIASLGSTFKSVFGSIPGLLTTVAVATVGIFVGIAENMRRLREEMIETKALTLDYTDRKIITNILEKYREAYDPKKSETERAAALKVADYGKAQLMARPDVIIRQLETFGPKLAELDKVFGGTLGRAGKSIAQIMEYPEVRIAGTDTFRGATPKIRGSLADALAVNFGGATLPATSLDTILGMPEGRRLIEAAVTSSKPIAIATKEAFDAYKTAVLSTKSTEDDNKYSALLAAFNDPKALAFVKGLNDMLYMVSSLEVGKELSEMLAGGADYETIRALIALQEKRKWNIEDLLADVSMSTKDFKKNFDDYDLSLGEGRAKEPRDPLLDLATRLADLRNDASIAGDLEKSSYMEQVSKAISGAFFDVSKNIKGGRLAKEDLPLYQTALTALTDWEKAPDALLKKLEGYYPGVGMDVFTEVEVRMKRESEAREAFMKKMVIDTPYAGSKSMQDYALGMAKLAAGGDRSVDFGAVNDYLSVALGPSWIKDTFGDSFLTISEDVFKALVDTMPDGFQKSLMILDRSEGGYGATALSADNMNRISDARFSLLLEQESDFNKQRYSLGRESGSLFDIFDILKPSSVAKMNAAWIDLLAGAEVVAHAFDAAGGNYETLSREVYDHIKAFLNPLKVLTKDTLDAAKIEIAGNKVKEEAYKQLLGIKEPSEEVKIALKQLGGAFEEAFQDFQMFSEGMLEIIAADGLGPERQAFALQRAKAAGYMNYSALGSGQNKAVKDALGFSLGEAFTDNFIRAAGTSAAGVSAQNYILENILGIKTDKAALATTLGYSDESFLLQEEIAAAGMTTLMDSGIVLATQGLASFAEWIWALITSTESFQNIMSNVTAILSGLLESVVVPLWDAMAPLVDLVISIVAIIADMLVPVFNTLRSIIQVLMPILIPIINAILVPLQAVLAAMLPIVKLLFDILGPIFGVFGSIFTLLSTLVVPIFEMLADVVNFVVVILSPVIAAFQLVAQAVGDFTNMLGYYSSHPIWEWWNYRDTTPNKTFGEFLSAILVASTGESEYVAAVAKAFSNIFTQDAKAEGNINALAYNGQGVTTIGSGGVAMGNFDAASSASGQANTPVVQDLYITINLDGQLVDGSLESRIVSLDDLVDVLADTLEARAART